MLILITKKEMNTRNIVKYLATRRIKSTILKTKLTIDNEEISDELIERILQDDSISEIRNYEEVLIASNTLKVKFQKVENSLRKFLKIVAKSKCKMYVSGDFVNVCLDGLKDIEIEQLIDILYDEFEIEELYINKIPQKSEFKVNKEPNEEAQVEEPKLEKVEESKSEAQVEESKLEEQVEVKLEVKKEVKTEVEVKAESKVKFEMYLENTLKENLESLKASKKSYQENLSEFLTKIGMDKEDEVIFKAFEVSRNLKKITISEVVKQVSKEIIVYKDSSSIKIHKQLLEAFDSWTAQKFPEVKDKYYRPSIISLIKVFTKYAPNSTEKRENDLKVLENETTTKNDSALEHKNAQEETMVQVEKEYSDEKTLEEFLKNKFEKVLKTPDRPNGMIICDVDKVLNEIGISPQDKIIRAAFLVSANSGPKTFCDLIRSIKQTLEKYKSEPQIKKELIKAFRKYDFSKWFTGEKVTTAKVIMIMLNLFSKKPNQNYFIKK